MNKLVKFWRRRRRRKKITSLAGCLDVCRWSFFRSLGMIHSYYTCFSRVGHLFCPLFSSSTHFLSPLSSHIFYSNPFLRKCHHVTCNLLASSDDTRTFLLLSLSHTHKSSLWCTFFLLFFSPFFPFFVSDSTLIFCLPSAL